MRTPPVLWAQTKDRILLKINTSATDVEVQLNELSVNVKGTDTNSKAPFSVDIELFKSIDTTKSKWEVKPSRIELVLIKLNTNESYWKQLLKQKVKPAWLSVDWNNFEDEDKDSDKSSDDEKEEEVPASKIQVPQIQLDANGNIPPEHVHQLYQKQQQINRNKLGTRGMESLD